jgi:hypothetical protein
MDAVAMGESIGHHEFRLAPLWRPSRSTMNTVGVTDRRTPSVTPPDDAVDLIELSVNTLAFARPSHPAPSPQRSPRRRLERSLPLLLGGLIAAQLTVSSMAVATRHSSTPVPRQGLTVDGDVRLLVRGSADGLPATMLLDLQTGDRQAARAPASIDAPSTIVTESGVFYLGLNGIRFLASPDLAPSKVLMAGSSEDLTLLGTAGADSVWVERRETNDRHGQVAVLNHDGQVSDWFETEGYRAGAVPGGVITTGPTAVYREAPTDNAYLGPGGATDIAGPFVLRTSCGERFECTLEAQDAMSGEVVASTRARLHQLRLGRATERISPTGEIALQSAEDGPDALRLCAPHGACATVPIPEESFIIGWLPHGGGALLQAGRRDLVRVHWSGGLLRTEVWRNALTDREFPVLLVPMS